MTAHNRHLADSQAQSREDAFDEFCDDAQKTLAALDIPPHAFTRAELLAAFSEGLNPQDAAEDFAAYYAENCLAK